MTFNSRRNASGLKNLQRYCNLTSKGLLPCLTYYTNCKIKGHKQKTITLLYMYRHISNLIFGISNMKFLKLCLTMQIIFLPMQYQTNEFFY